MVAYISVSLFVVPIYAFGWPGFPDKAECTGELIHPDFFTMQGVYTASMFLVMLYR